MHFCNEDFGFGSAFLEVNLQFIDCVLVSLYRYISRLCARFRVAMKCSVWIKSHSHHIIGKYYVQFHGNNSMEKKGYILLEKGFN